VKDLYLRSPFYTAFVWAIFNVGSTQLAWILAGNLAFGITMLSVAGLFAFFLFKFENGTYRSVKNYVKTYLLSAGMVLILESIYMYLAFLEPGISVIIFACVHAVVFLIPMAFVIPFFKTSSHVSG
jgi:hypothetical protein